MTRPPTWAESDTEGAACESLPFEEAAALFMPESDGGMLRRTRAFPSPDSHADARAVCARCPIITECLTSAMRHDPWTFRGGLSPEERAAFGGYRDPEVARRREVYLSRPRVWSRVLMSRLPADVMKAALSTWREYLISGDEAALRIGDFTGVGGPSGRATPHAAAAASPEILDDWFTEYEPPKRPARPKQHGPVQDFLPLG